MFVLGLIILVVGVVTGISILQTIGTLLLLIGAVLMIVGYAHGPVFGDRRYWF